MFYFLAMSEDYAPSMASTAYSDDDKTSEIFAEIQKLESILLKQLDKETSRFGSASSSSSSFSGLKQGDVDVPSSPIDLDGASSINFSQFLDAQDSHSSVAGGGARSTAQSSAYWSQVDGASTAQRDYDEASDLLDNQSCTSLRKELSQVVTPYGHVSKHVQAYEDLTPPPQEGDARFVVPQQEADETSQQQSIYRTGAFAGTDGSVVGGGSVASGMEELTQRTAALSTAATEDIQSTASHPSHAQSSASTAPPTPNQVPSTPPQYEEQVLLSQTQKIKSLLQNLESQLTQVTTAASNMAPSSPPSMGLEIQNSIRSLSFLEDSLKKQPWVTPSIPEEGDEVGSSSSSSFAAHSRTRLNNIRQKLWGGPSPAQQSRTRPSPEEQYVVDDDVDNASVIGQVSTDVVHHYPPIAKEEIGCCKPKEEEQPIRPRDDYFSAAYQNAFACSSAYHLDLPEPGTANVSSTPNATGGKNYYYYYPAPEAMPNAACCRVPPVEKILTALKRLEVKVASCHANHLRRRQQQQQQRFPDGAVLHQYELADLDLSNPARAERYHEL